MLMRVSVLVGAILTVATAAALPAGAVAATFNVNSTSDAVSAVAANGVCDADAGTGGNQCTIREALKEEAAIGGQDDINVPAGTYPVSQFVGGPLTVADDIRLQGAGASATQIHATGGGPIFHVNLGAEAQLRNVTLRDGQGTNGGAIHNEGSLVVFESVLRGNSATNGGAIHASGPSLNVIASTIGGPSADDVNTASSAGGGIFVPSGSPPTHVTVTNSTIQGNRADAASTGPVGGGISMGTGNELEITGSTVLSNRALSTGGFAAVGGGIWTVSKLTLRDSQVVGNSATGNPDSHAGGLMIGGGGEILRTTFRENIAADTAGAIQVGGAGGTSLTVSDSTLFANIAINAGGGIVADRATVVHNSTLSSNFTLGTSSTGGGVYVGSTGSLGVIHSTIAGNGSETTGEAVYTTAPSGGGFLPPTLVRASILSGLDGPACGKAASAAGIFSAGFNVVTDATCNATQATDRPSTDPLLAPLADNGGPTQTHAIGPGSPALDLVTSNCPPPAADQRGVVRPAFAACDSGSFEFSTSPPGEPPPVGETPGPGDTELRLDVAAKPKQRLKRLSVTASCPQEACEVGAAGKATAKQRKLAGRRLAKAKRFRFQPVIEELAPAESEKLRLRLRPKARKKLTKLLEAGAKTKAKLLVSAVDAAGNGDLVRLTVRLKP